MVVWERDYSEGEEIEAELAFYRKTQPSPHFERRQPLTQVSPVGAVSSSRASDGRAHALRVGP
jgi:hypothetical protein